MRRTHDMEEEQARAEALMRPPQFGAHHQQRATQHIAGRGRPFFAPSSAAIRERLSRPAAPPPTTLPPRHASSAAYMPGAVAASAAAHAAAGQSAAAVPVPAAGVIDLTEDEALAASLQMAEWNSSTAAVTAAAAAAPAIAVQKAADAHAAASAAAVAAALAADDRAAQEEADARLARQLAGETPLASSLNSAAHMASLQAVRTLEAQAEAALTQGPSYREQLRAAIKARNKKGAPFSKPVRSAEQVASARTDRAMNRRAQRELSLRQEEGRLRDVGSAASGHVGNQWAALGDLIEPSADETDSSHAESDEEKEQQEAEQMPTAASPAAAALATAAAAETAAASSAASANATAAVPDTSNSAAASASSAQPASEALLSHRTSSPPILPLMSAAGPPLLPPIAGLEATAAAPRSDAPDLQEQPMDMDESVAKDTADVSDQSDTVNGPSAEVESASAAAAAPASAAAAAAAATAEAASASAAVVPSIVAAASTPALDASAAGAAPTSAAMPSASSLLALDGDAAAAESDDSAEVLSSGSEGDDDDSDVEIVGFVSKPAAAATAAVAASKGQVGAQNPAAANPAAAAASGGAASRPNFYAPHSGSSVQGFKPLGTPPAAAAARLTRSATKVNAKGKSAVAAATAAAAAQAALQESDNDMSPPPSPESSRFRALYGAPPDPAAVAPPPAAALAGKKRPHGHVAGAGSVLAPSTKKQKKAERKRLQLLQHQNRLMEQQLGVGSAAAAAAAAAGPAVNALGPRGARYYSKHEKPLPPSDSTPYSLDTHFSPSELWSLSSDWSGVRHVVLLDLDNWVGFFRRLPWCFADDVYLWVFHGKNTTPKIERTCKPFLHLKEKQHIQFTRCGERPDAADFALCLKLGELNQLCAKDIPFTLFSGDRGFDEMLLHIPDRRVQRIDPHHSGTNEETFALLKSIADT